ncbi:uncharacterized protein LOC121681667 isoform X4 [Alosa sapidissima]|uniref:uncharacterized protein LOC121681667 isoform X4 n=1 Tax=Alosa sapidissima TaxID=34773 RepID=UPI001C0A49DF|nr:uncharacterized protein LOC121681667 isoform X4 [Alosa sapidissima]
MIFPYILPLVISYAYTDGKPDQPDTRVIATTGENVTLKCEINLTSIQHQFIFWIRMKQPKELQHVLGTLAKSESYILYDGFSKQRFKSVNKNEKYYLQMFNYQDSDSGIYYCGYNSLVVLKFGSGIPLNYEETLMGYVIGLGVTLSVCVAVMAFFIASRLRRPTCEHCKERAQKQMHCNNSVVEETRMHLDDVIYTTVIYDIKTLLLYLVHANIL